MVTKSPATRRYIRTHIALSILYVACVMLASYFVPDDAAPTPGVVMLSILPGLAVLGWIWNLGGFLLSLEDEYLRLLEIRKALVATALTLGICGSWGLLELFVTVPRLPVFFVLPIWFLGLAVGSIVNKVTMNDGEKSRS